MPTETGRDMDDDQGYFVISVPRKMFFQGFFASDRYRVISEQIVSMARLVAKGQMPYVSQKPEIFKAAGDLPSDTETQGAVAAISAMMIDYLEKKDVRGITATAYAMILLTGQKYFIVEGRGNTDAGFGTSYQKIEADTADQARAIINARPDFITMKAFATINESH